MPLKLFKWKKNISNDKEGSTADDWLYTAVQIAKVSAGIGEFPGVPVLKAASNLFLSLLEPVQVRTVSSLLHQYPIIRSLATS
jgi:hypothetical protein